MAGKKLSRNDPCPCGSGKKYKHCCYRRDREREDEESGRHTEQVQYPLGTVAFYGPNDRTTTKIVAAVFRHAEAEPILNRWVGTDVTTSPKVEKELQEFFQQHGAKRVVMTQGNMGCPHEEGEDFPMGEDCPFCPFWRGKQGSNRRD